VLDGLKPGDAASVVLASRRQDDSEVLFPQFTDQLNDVRQAVDRLEVASLGTDLAAAIRQAEKLTGSTDAPRREIYVFSDLQRSGWEEPEATAGSRKESPVSFVVVGVRPRERVTNRAVTAVQYAAPRPMVGVPFA